MTFPREPQSPVLLICHDYRLVHSETGGLDDEENLSRHHRH
jgi:hypothetical protein